MSGWRPHSLLPDPDLVLGQQILLGPSLLCDCFPCLPCHLSSLLYLQMFMFLLVSPHPLLTCLQSLLPLLPLFLFPLSPFSALPSFPNPFFLCSIFYTIYSNLPLSLGMTHDSLTSDVFYSDVSLASLLPGYLIFSSLASLISLSSHIADVPALPAQGFSTSFLLIPQELSDNLLVPPLI